MSLERCHRNSITMSYRIYKMAHTDIKTAIQATTPRVDDAWFDQGSFLTSKHPVSIQYKTATDNGTIETLEGPVKYIAGHKIITGPKGEQYPISQIKFAAYYDDDGNGTATPKPIVKRAKLADHDGVVHASWGDLAYKRGEDYIVNHGANDFGVVKKDIFNQTYDTSKLGGT